MKKKFLSLIALVALAVGITVAVNYVPGNGLKLLGKSEKAEFAGKLNSSSIDICKNVDMKGMSVKKGTMPKTADEGWGEWAEFAPGGSNDAVWTLTAWQTGTLNVKTYVRTSTADATKKQIKCAGWGADFFTDAGVDILLDWNTTDNTIEIPMQSTGYYVSNYKDYAVLGTFKTGKYDPEQGQFSFHVGYSVPQYYVMGKGFGFGDETLQMAGNFKDYSLSFSRGTVDDVATPIKQTINVYPGADITSYRVHVDTYENYAAAQGSAAYFEALAKAEGTDYTDPSATVELKGSAYNIYVVVVSAFVGTEMKKYAYDMYEVSPASDWETIGLRPYREDIVTSLYNFGITGPVYNVEVQKHKTYRDIYRIKNPYGSTSPFKGYTLYENAYLYLNAQNPTKVSPTFQLSRCDLGIDVEGGMPLNVLLADDEVGGTFDGYAISFPTRALVSNNYYVNTNGLFRAVINFRDAEFAFADSVESVYTGETVKIISNNTLSVPTFESLTPEIATVDAKGVVTAVAPGKAQIKVVQDAILEFNAKETVMEIDVKKNPNSYASFVFNTDEGLAALGIEKPAASAATNLTGMTLTSGDVSMTSTDGGTATRVWNTNDVTDLRMYKNGGSFTFSVPEGYKIISIDFTGTECSLFGEESEFETCTKAHTVWNAPEGESVTSKTFAAVGTCKISAIKVKYSAPSLLPPLASNAYYSWQSPEGTVEEVGGKAVASEADPARVNYPQLKYYTISLNGKKDLSDGKYTTVTLEKPLAEGDTIIVFAFKNKDDDSKKSGVKFFWGAEGTESAMACGDDFPNLYSGGEPALVKYVVPKDAAGKNVFRMTRSETGTNLFIAQLQIVPAGEAPASTSNLGNIIAKAVEGKAQGETAVVTLDATVAYDLKNPVDAGLVNLVVNGNGAIVKLGPTGQIAGMQGIEINNVNFDCDNNTIAPIALSANPDSVLVGSKFQEEGTSLRGGAFYNTGAIVINGCNFSGIHTSWISANKREWNLKTLKIVNTIAQFDVATGVDSYINWVGNSNNEGSIKDIIIEGSTLYNIVESNDNRFLRLQNNSNSQAQKAWAEPQFDAKESWVMTNNTFVNMPSNKEFANNYPNKNNVTFDFKGNIFYNTWRLQKIASSAVRNFTAADNAIIGITNPVDGTDASSYATIDSLLIIGEKPFVVPTTALDLTKEIDLKANFTPANDSYSGINGFGDPRWKVSAPATVYYSQDYENGATSDWSTQVGGRFDPEIGEDANGNHYLRAAAGTRTANGTGMYSNAYNEKLAAGTPFTMTADIHLRSANGQNGTEFTVGAAGASYNFSKWTLTGTMTLNMKQVSAGGTNQWILNGDVDNPITLPGTETLAGTDATEIYDKAPWYSIMLSWKDGLTFFSIKDKATGEVIVDKQQLKTNDSFASVGGVGQLWFSTSRYNAAFAIDNVVIRDIIDGDLPVIIPTTYTLNYVHEGDGAVLKDPVVLNTTVGTEVTASSADMASFFNAEKSMKYIYKEGNTTIVASEDSAANVITLVYRDAAMLKYTVKSTGLPEGYEFDFTPYANPGDKFAEQWEGELVSVAYPQFVKVDDVLWTCPAGKYVAKTFNKEFTITTATKETVEYTDNYTIMNVTAGSKYNKLKDIVYYKEGEEIWPENTCTAPNQYVRCSYGKAGAPALNEKAEIVTLPAGTYRVGMQFAQATTAAQKETFDLFIGEDTLFKAAIYGYVQSYQSTEFTITKDTKLYLKGLTVDGGGLDWIYVQKVVREEATIEFAGESTVMHVGDENPLTFDYTNSGATITYTSSNPEVGIVSEDGKFTAISVGKTVITATLAATDYTYAASTQVVIKVREVPVPVTTVRAWDFSKIATAYAEDYAAMKSNAEYWEGTGDYRMFFKKSLDDEELTSNGAHKLSFAEGILWTADAWKILVGDGSENYEYIQIQKGAEFYIPNVGAKDTIKFVGYAPSTSGSLEFYNCEPSVIDFHWGGTYESYQVVVTAAGEFDFKAPQDFRLQSIVIIPEGEVYTGSNDPTGINDISAKNAQFFGEGTYDLNGRKVMNPVKGNVYIVNGKKYLCK